VSKRIRFNVNGETRETEVRDDESAVEVLRDRLGLTGTKLVCGDGVCGACTVVLDGVPVNTCVLPAAALEGSELKTVEAFGPQLHPVQRAFVAHDALQCGYCTPGFVVEAIAFHDRWRAERGTAEPTRDDVVRALAGHLCRCGAYVGIVAAVRDACAGRFDAVEPASPRLEARAKVTGATVYAADVRNEDQLEGVILRSTHAHARVTALDLEPARALDGIRAALELVGEERLVRYIGQEIAAVAAVDRRTAERALELIRVEYEVLPAAIGMDAARGDDAARVYTGVRRRPPNAAEGPLFPARWRGNVRGPSSFSRRARTARRLVAEARAAGDPLLVEGRWRTEAQLHTAFEPHVCVARWEGGSLHVHVSTQAAAAVADELAEHFELPEGRVRLVAEHVGGGFGAKMRLTPETVAAAELARAAGAPVRVALDRAEELSVGGYRPAAELDLALLPSSSDGLRALRLRVHGDSGVAVGSQIAGLARFVYPAPAMELVDYDVVNHMPPGSPFRGPGAPVCAWALEQAVDEAAHRLREDPIALRRRLDPNPLRRRLYVWAEALELWQQRPPTGSQSGRFRRGVGVAAANWLYLYQPNCCVEVGVERGRLFAATAVQDMGTGSRSVLARTLGTAFGLEPKDVDVRIGDTRHVRGPSSGGSRTTASIVPAALAAVSLLCEELVRDAQTRLGLRDARANDAGITHAEGAMSWREVIASAPNLAAVAGRPDDDRRASDAARPLAGAGPAGVVMRVAMHRVMPLDVGRGMTGAVHVSEVEVDTQLGTVRALKVAGGLAAGRIAAPELARSQCYGGIIQGIGYALYEQRQIDPRSGLVLTTGLEDYRIPGIGDVPEIELHFVEKGFEHVPGGSVGLGELSTIGVAASIGNAVHNATGWRPYELPIRTDRLLAGVSGE
jgi:CO/xanthine dehydrogenase Mo-binding subunit/aerobic-type carbon monoxide dehydrogenase small subunit (CoxS/CutS family)